jgi:hypothetical protein
MHGVGFSHFNKSTYIPSPEAHCYASPHRVPPPPPPRPSAIAPSSSPSPSSLPAARGVAG